MEGAPILAESSFLSNGDVSVGSACPLERAMMLQFARLREGLNCMVHIDGLF